VERLVVIQVKHICEFEVFAVI